MPNRAVLWALSMFWHHTFLTNPNDFGPSLAVMSAAVTTCVLSSGIGDLVAKIDLVAKYISLLSGVVTGIPRLRARKQKH